MAAKQITVVINGEETVGQATKQAEASLSGFAGFMQQLKGKLVPVIDVTKLVEFAVRAMSAAFQAAKQFVMDSIGAYDAYQTAQVKLAAQSKLTGMSMREMNELVDTARTKFGLGTVAAVDIAAAVAKFSTAAGISGRSAEAMAAALELGAAAGMNAQQVAEGLSSAFAGNDEWLNRLGLANPSQLWKDYAEANGLAVSKLTDSQQKLAVLTAIMDAGNKVAGVYSERMASGAGAQERLNNRFDEAKIAFGAAIQPLRVFVVQGLTALLNVLGPVLTAIAYLSSGILNLAIGPLKLAYSGLGSVVEVVGKLTGNKDLERWGKNASQEFMRFTDEMAKWLGVTKPATEAAREKGKAHELAAVKITASTEAIKKNAETTEQAAARMNRALDDKLGRPMQAVIGMTTGAIESLSRAATDQLAPEAAAKFNAHMRSLADNAKLVAERVTTTATETEKGSRNGRSMADEIGMVARGALDAAQSFGVIDDTAARSLNSAINIASALGRIASSGFSFAGVTGVIGGVAALVNTMMAGDRDRREMLRQNSRAILGLTEEVSGLNLNVSGSDIEGATRGLQSLMRNGFMPAGRMDNATLWDALQAQGLTIGQLDRIATELGIRIRDKDGNISGLGLNDLLTAMSRVSPGRVGQSFTDQLEFFRQGQRLDGAEGTLGGVSGLLDFLRNVGGVSALSGLDASDPAALRSSLRNLITQLNNGTGVGNDQLGRLTGSQFMQLLMSIIDTLDNMEQGSAPESDAPSADESELTDGPLVPITSGGFAISLKDVNDTIADMRDQTVPILTAHTTLHERIAAATEGSYMRLSSIDTKMDTLIAVTANQAAGVDARLESLRRLAALERGELPVLR